MYRIFDTEEECAQCTCAVEGRKKGSSSSLTNNQGHHSQVSNVNASCLKFWIQLAKGN